MIAAVVEAGPHDEHVRLLDGAGAAVLDVVHVRHLLAELVLVLVARGERLGDVVLDVLGLGGAGDAPVAGHADGDADEALVVLVGGRALLLVGAVGGQVEVVLGQELLLPLLQGLQEDADGGAGVGGKRVAYLALKGAVVGLKTRNINSMVIWSGTLFERKID